MKRQLMIIWYALRHERNKSFSIIPNSFISHDTVTKNKLDIWNYKLTVGYNVGSFDIRVGHEESTVYYQ